MTESTDTTAKAKADAPAHEAPETVEPVTLSNGTVVSVVKDFESVPHHDKADAASVQRAEEATTVTPFQVRATAPDGSVTAVECDSEDEANGLHKAVSALAQLLHL